MAFQEHKLHFVLLPLMAQGHMIPMVDIARMLARRGVIISLITTPTNFNRLRTSINRAVESGLQIRVLHLNFPSVEAGLPEGCENFDMLSSIVEAPKFFKGLGMLQQQVERLLEKLEPPPSCIISDMCFPWTTEVAQKFHIPRLVFHGMGCFSLFCCYNVYNTKILDQITSDSEYFIVPGMPDQIEITKSQLSGIIISNASEMKELGDKMREAETKAYGIVVNTFEELEAEYVKEYREAKGKPVWCIGPVSLSNKNDSDKASRGNKASIDEHHCLKWLDSWDPSSVIYVCLGSLSRLSLPQMTELGLALEESNRPFIWVLRNRPDSFVNWLTDENFEERIKGRGLLICGWAPQVLILSHPAIGGFLTHCGWNSTLEGVSAGVPMITCPLFAEQFCNEKLVINVLKIGVSLGVEVPVVFGEEDKSGVLVAKDDIKRAVDRLMDQGDEGEERRRKARELGKMAKEAMEEEGSSFLSMTLLIQDIIMEQSNSNQLSSKK